MTSAELLSLIQSDASASSLAAAGNDSGCAARCMVIAPLLRVPAVLTSRGLYKAIGPSTAETILQKLAGYADANQTYSAIIARFLEWMEPANEGADFGDSDLLNLASGLLAGGVLTQSEFDALNGISLKPPVITANDVSKALRGQ
jgi:hypothetical protein